MYSIGAPRARNADRRSVNVLGERGHGSPARVKRRTWKSRHRKGSNRSNDGTSDPVEVFRSRSLSGHLDFLRSHFRPCSSRPIGRLVPLLWRPLLAPPSRGQFKRGVIKGHPIWRERADRAWSDALNDSRLDEPDESPPSHVRFNLRGIIRSERANRVFISPCTKLCLAYDALGVLAWILPRIIHEQGKSELPVKLTRNFLGCGRIFSEIYICIYVYLHLYICVYISWARRRDNRVRSPVDPNLPFDYSGRKFSESVDGYFALFIVTRVCPFLARLTIYRTYASSSGRLRRTSGYQFRNVCYPVIDEIPVNVSVAIETRVVRPFLGKRKNEIFYYRWKYLECSVPVISRVNFTRWWITRATNASCR